MEHRVPAAEPDARLTELGTVQQQAELRVVEPGAVGIERVADRGEAGTGPQSNGPQFAMQALSRAWLRTWKLGYGPRRV